MSVFLDTSHFSLRTALTLTFFAVSAIFLHSCSEDHTHAPGEHFEAEGAVFLDGSRATY